MARSPASEATTRKTPAKKAPASPAAQKAPAKKATQKATAQKAPAKKSAAGLTAGKRRIRAAVKSAPSRPVYRYYLPEPTNPGPTVTTFNELVHNASDALQRAAGGESFLITVHRHPICKFVQYTARRAASFADELADEKPIAVSVLRQDTAYRIYRAQAGTPAVVTLRGKPLAMLVPIRRRPGRAADQAPTA